jgi:type II secretion system protein N
MSIPKPLRIVGYVAWFLSCLVFFFYATFPISAIKGTIEAEMEKSLGKGKQGRYGVDPDVQIGDLELWRLSGAKAEQVTIQLGSKDPDPGPSFFLDEVAVRVGIFSFLLGDPTVSFDIEAYNGDISGSATVDLKPSTTGKSKRKPPPQLKALDVEIDDVDVARIPAVVGKVGVPMTGKLVGKVQLDLGPKPEKQAEGEIDLAVKGVQLGPGELTIPVPGLSGGLSVPLIDMGDIVLKMNVDKGKAESEKVGITGKDFSADIETKLTFNRRMAVSGIRGDGWFQISDAFLDKNGKFKTILEIAQPLKKAKDDEGRYQFRLAGTLSSPRFNLGKSKSRKRR